VSLAEEYQRQYQWRPWPQIYAALPPLRHLTILDLGCAIGDQAADLSARGARVIGVDANEELVTAARSRVDGQFIVGDLRKIAVDVEADGIWSSFTAAYFPHDFVDVLRTWRSQLKPNGWIAVTEVDDLFGHEPVSERTRSLLGDFADDALRAGRYDSRMGRKLPAYLEDAGFSVNATFKCEESELSFGGAAEPDVIDAWRARFARMPRLRDLCGEEFDAVRDDFLTCLSRNDHRSLASVFCTIASTT